MKYIFWLSVLLLAGQTGISDGVGRTKPPKKSQSLKEAEITVSYCDLVKDQAKYAGKLIRVRTIVLGWLDGTALYDSGCGKDGLEPVFDCKDEEECSALQKTLQKDTDYNGDVGRVEAILIGRVVLPRDTAAGKSRSKFMIKEIEQTKRIPRDVPWPGETLINDADFSLTTLFVLHDEGRDYSDDVLLLTAWETRDILEDPLHLPRWSSLLV